MPDGQKGSRTLAGARAAGRARIPYWLIAAVFAPLAGAYAALLRNVEGFRFAHPWVLALIPPAVALVLWMELGHGARAGGRFFSTRARRSWAGSGRGWSRGCASCRRCCGWRPSCW